MGNKGRSDPNIFGGYTHYDEHGKKIGSSSPNIFGGYTNYDAKGHKIGTSDPNLFGGYTTRDARGHKIGESGPNLFGGYTHYDANHKKVGSSDPKLFGGYSNNDDTQGCYIATCVYGSYDCPEVWTLRRFRDYSLAASFPGRLFIRSYYAVSPKLVSRFGKTGWFRMFWRHLLDHFVARLKKHGVMDTPYRDRDW